MDTPRLMLVVSKRLPGVALYDADTHAVLGRAAMGISPHEAAFSRDGRFAFVPVYGSGGVGKPGTDEHVLHFVSTADCRIVHSLDTGKYTRPHGIEVGRESGTIYLTSENAQAVVLIDPLERRILAEIPTGSPYSHMLAVTRDESKAYVSNVHSKTVSVLDLAARRIADIVDTGSPCQRMALSPDERWFVTNLGPEHKVAFFRTSDDRLDFEAEVDGEPFVARFSADGKYLYVAGHRDGQARAWKIDTGRKKAIATSGEDLGRDVGSLVVNPFDGNVYISDQPTNTISILDAETWRVKQRLATDQSPDCMVFTELLPAGQDVDS